MNPSRWPDTGRYRSNLQCTAWLWFFEHGGERRMMHTPAAERELGKWDRAALDQVGELELVEALKATPRAAHVRRVNSRT